MTDDELIARAERAGWVWHENITAWPGSSGYPATGWRMAGNSFSNCKASDKAHDLRAGRPGQPAPVGRGFDHEHNCHECGKPIWLGWDDGTEKKLICRKECFNCCYYMDLIRYIEIGAKTAIPGLLVIEKNETDLDDADNIRTVRSIYDSNVGSHHSTYNGYGGTTFTIRVLATGLIFKTCDLIHKGEVPARFLDRLPPNAEFYVDAVELMVEAAKNQLAKEHREWVDGNIEGQAKKKILKKKRRRA